MDIRYRIHRIWCWLFHKPLWVFHGRAVVNMSTKPYYYCPWCGSMWTNEDVKAYLGGDIQNIDYYHTRFVKGE